MKKGFWVVVKEIIRRCDIVLHVVDARFPELTRVKQAERWAKQAGKKVILVINKIDLVKASTVTNLKKEYSDENIVFISAKKSRNIMDLIAKIKTLTKADPIKVSIIGYPNTGKSSLINRLSRGGKAKTSSESGYTRGKQLIKGKSNLMLMDTPGVVPYEARDEVRLGLVSGISPQKLQDPDLVAFSLMEIFQKNNPQEIEKVYDINIEAAGDDILEILGEKWNMLLKKGEIDERRAAIKILEDWHKGNIKL